MVLALLATGLAAVALVFTWLPPRSNQPKTAGCKHETGGKALVLGRKAAHIALFLLFIAATILTALWRQGERQGASGFPLVHTLFLAGSMLVAGLAYSSRRQEAKKALVRSDEAAIDTLTRVASHRAFQDRLRHECERAYRFGDTFVLIMLDLDDFHLVNNRHSHRVGDEILVHLAARVQNELREIDLLARFGGDQFAMILPHTLPHDGAHVAERIRQKIASWVFIAPEGPEIRLTVSLGLCSYPTHGASPPELVERAQHALTLAKALGGNQVQSYQNVPALKDPENVVSLSARREAIVQSLATAVDLRDGYTHEHSKFVSELAAAVARRIGLAAREVSRVAVGALLHDVGKIGIPDSILTKESSLSPEEWECVKRHPLLGKQILEQAPELADVIPLVLHHQERYDGTGYPHQLRGDRIPLGARIIAVADAYHAIRSNRPYRQGRSHHEALRELRRCAGTQFDPQITEIMMQILETDETIRAILPTDPELEKLGHTRAVQQHAVSYQ